MDSNRFGRKVNFVTARNTLGAKISFVEKSGFSVGEIRSEVRVLSSLWSKHHQFLDWGRGGFWTAGYAPRRRPKRCETRLNSRKRSFLHIRVFFIPIGTRLGPIHRAWNTLMARF